MSSLPGQGRGTGPVCDDWDWKGVSYQLESLLLMGVSYSPFMLPQCHRSLAWDGRIGGRDEETQGMHILGHCFMWEKNNSQILIWNFLSKLDSKIFCSASFQLYFAQLVQLMIKGKRTAQMQCRDSLLNQGIGTWLSAMWFKIFSHSRSSDSYSVIIFLALHPPETVKWISM